MADYQNWTWSIGVVAPHPLFVFGKRIKEKEVNNACSIETLTTCILLMLFQAKFSMWWTISNYCFVGHARERGTISEEILRSAVSSTEDGFLTHVRRSCGIKPLIAAVGSCCLVGVIWRGTLFVANLGDSRAVIGSSGRSNKIVAEQLTRDHNASMEEVRQELKSLHPDDSHIVVMKHGVWRIKGIIQVHFYHYDFKCLLALKL